MLGRVDIAAASALIRDGRGRVLVVLRGEGPNRGKWSLPGGKRELGEPLLRTAEREVAEETGLQVRAVTELETVLVDAAPDRYEIHVVAATLVGGELRAADDAAAARWVDMDQLAELPVTEGLVELIDRHRPTGS